MASGCSACRCSALRLILGGITPVRPQARLRRLPFYQTRARYSALQSTRHLLKSPAIREIREADSEAANSNTPREAYSSNEGSTTRQDAQPWYLQVEAPKHPTLIHEAPPLPDAPEGSPKVMKSLIKFIAEDVGLDRLSLLDLRKMDPPAALGPDLFMLIGTARSERHLHVSAGRLVRWLRDRGIHANADGLLGRNELKIKLRRRLRKEKLLGGNGSVSREFDDGISTGWICVNLGTLGWTGMEQELFDDKGRSIGFGRLSTGSTVVVQMLTESKREELNLEKLWTGIHRRNLARTDPNLHEPPALEERRSVPLHLKPYTESQTKVPDGRRHASTYSREANMPGVAGHYASWLKIAQGAALGREIPDPAVLHPLAGQYLSKLLQQEANGQPDDQLVPSHLATIESALTHDMDVKMFLLDHLENELQALSNKDFAAAVGIASLEVQDKKGKHQSEEVDAEESKETQTVRLPPYLRLFERALQNLPIAEVWRRRLFLKTEAIVRGLGHFGYNIADVQTLVDAMRHLIFPITREQFIALLKAIYAAPGTDSATTRAQSTLALQVINTMYERSLPVLSHDVIVAVIESLLQAGIHHSTPESTRLLSTFEYLLIHAPLPCPAPPVLCRLIAAYASRDLWPRVWEIWRIPPRYNSPRTHDMYVSLLLLVARTGNQTLCIQALRWTLPEMACEVPRVRVEGHLRDVVLACARVADPSAERTARLLAAKAANGNRRESRHGRREFVKLFRALIKSGALS